MLIVNNKRYIKKHVVGGSGIFGSVLRKLLTSNAVRSVASDIGKSAINAGKEVAISAISSAIEKRKTLPVITQNNKDLLTSLISNNEDPRLLVGRGQQNVIRIEDLVRNGRGLRLA